MDTVRPAAVAGTFYPADPRELTQTVTDLLSAARTRTGPVANGGPPKALLVPHAGYIYSGSTAALGYVHLEPARDRITRVVLLGPAHRVAITGLAVPTVDRLATPLGQVRIDHLDPDLRERLPQVIDHDQAHAAEHSLEVQLPFLQSVLGDIDVIPLVVGRASPEEVAQTLDALWGGPETLVVISSDLSHYLPHQAARMADDATIAQLMCLRGPLTHDQACGATPANGLLLTAERRRLRPALLGACTSGDTAGDRRRVVGYAALSFTEGTHART